MKLEEDEGKKLRSSWGVFFLNNHKRKGHINPECQYVKEGARKRPLSNYPVGYLEFCEGCIEYWRNWYNADYSPDTDETCDRCGCSCEYEYCDECHRVVERRVAQRVI